MINCIMLYILLAYLMLIAALSDAICIMLLFFLFFFCHRFLQMLFIFMLCLGLLTHSLFISCIICIMHSASNLLVFSNSMFTLFFFF